MPYRYLTLILATFLLSSSLVFAAPTTPTSVFDATVLEPGVTNNRMNAQVNISQVKPSNGTNPVTITKLDLEGAVDNGSFSVIGTKGPVTPAIGSPSQYAFSVTNVPCNKNIQIRFKLYAGTEVYSTRTTSIVTCANGGGTEVLPDGTYVLPSSKGGSYKIVVQLPQPGDFIKSGTSYKTTVRFTYSNNTQPKQSATFSYTFGKQGELEESHDFPSTNTNSTYAPILNNLACGTPYTIKIKVTEGSQVYSVPQTLTFNTPSCDGSDGGGATDGAVTVVTSAEAVPSQPKVLLNSRIEVPNYSNFSGRSVTYGFEMKSGSGSFTQVGTSKTSTVTDRNATVATEPITAGDGTSLSCATTYTFRAWAKMNTHTNNTVGDSKYIGNEVSITTGTCQQNTGGSGGSNGNGTVSTLGRTDDSGAYRLLVPSLPIGTNGVVQISGGTGFAGVMKQLFNIFLTVAIVLAVIFLIYGGAKYATSDAAFSLDEGKKLIRNAVTGLAFALFSWLLLNTINTDLVKVTLKIPEITQKVGDALAGSISGTGTSGGNTSTSSSTPVSSNYQALFDQTKADDSRVRNQLVGVSINRSQPCDNLGPQPKGTQNCTLVGLLGSSAITNLVLLKNKCGAGCEVQVTGGTEWWQHGTQVINQSRTATNHYPGNSTVDISNSNNVLNTYISKGTKSSAPSPFEYKITNVPGVPGIFYSEGDHWHVQF